MKRILSQPQQTTDFVLVSDLKPSIEFQYIGLSLPDGTRGILREDCSNSLHMFQEAWDNEIVQTHLDSLKLTLPEMVKRLEENNIVVFSFESLRELLRWVSNGSDVIF
jgi:hypothetical protein